MVDEIYSFTGDCYVNEIGKYVRDVKKGDRLGNAIVLCVIKTKFESGGLCEFGDDKEYISMYHPIMYDDKWVFAKDVYDVEMLSLDEMNSIGYVYNFVLKFAREHQVLKNYSLTINNVECAMLGHTFKDYDVLKHPFFGDRKKFIDCIKYLPGYNSGLITLKQHNYIKDENGIINSIKF